MSRRKVAKKRPVAPDPVYQSRLVSLLVSHLLKKGKKSLAYRIFYEAMTQISETTSQDPHLRNQVLHHYLQHKPMVLLFQIQVSTCDHLLACQSMLQH